MTVLRASAVLLGLLLLVMLGCHSLSLKAPAGPGPEVQQKWFKDYQWARANQISDPAKSCTLFTDLGNDSLFPAHAVAKLRAIETCRTEAMPVLDRAQWPSYLQESATNIYLKLASERKDLNAEMELAFEKSKQKLPQNEKIKWMNLAVQRAEELALAERRDEFKKRLYSIAPRLDPEPSEKNYLSLASDLRMARQFPKAREYYDKVVTSEDFDVEAKISALKGIRLSYKNSRQDETHILASRRLIDFVKRELKATPRAHKLLATGFDSELYLARALWTLGRTSDAEKIFIRLQKSMKGKASLAELYWLRGRLAEDQNDLEAVSHFMNLAIKERFTSTELRDKILWYTAWNEKRRHNFGRATEVLQELSDKTQTDFTRARALYWLGRTQSDINAAEEAEKTFRRLIDLDPLGYYGLLAHRQLKLPIKLQTPTSEVAPLDPATLPMDINVADWLSQLDEKEALTALLDESSQLYKKSQAQSDDGWVRIFQYYARGGLYMKLYEGLATLTPERRKSIFEHHPHLLFPQPWTEDTSKAGLQFGIEPELIYAIIRQESAFDPHARSVADAFGVMQLLPEVAEQLATKYAIPYSTMEDLYDPKTNIYLGAAHLKELFARHRGQFILAVASYNASESVIRNWMKTRFHGDAMEFIEDIPYEETRAYVRLVMRNLIFYNLLKSKNTAIEFPDWVLKLEG